MAVDDGARAGGAGLWVGDCFIYNNAAWRLNYCVGGEVTTMFHLDRPMYLLGYLASQSRVYLIDKARAAAWPAPPCRSMRALAGALPGTGCPLRTRGVCRLSAHAQDLAACCCIAFGCS